jgi:hypothetical protein
MSSRHFQIGLYNLLPKVLDADPVIYAGLQAEFQAVKIELYNIACSYSSTMPCFFEGLQLLQDSKMQLLKYANFMKMVYIMLCIPLNTACCERGFLIHTAVKTKVRSRTSIEILDGLLRIKCVYPAELVKPADGSPAEESRKAFLGAVTAACPKTVKLHAGAEALQAPATDVEEGSEDNDSQCSIAVSLDALENCEEEIMSEEEDWDFVFQPACVSESLEGVQVGGRCL